MDKSEYDIAYENAAALLKKIGNVNPYVAVEQRMEDLPEYLQAIVIKIEKCAREQDSDALFRYYASRNEGLTQLDTSVYKYEDHYINFFYTFWGNPYIANLSIVSRIGLSIAPQLIYVAQKDNTQYVFTKIPGTKSGNLISLFYGNGCPSEPAIALALTDVKKLLTAGYYNEEIVNREGVYAWHITPDDGRLVVPGWSRLVPVDAGVTSDEYLTKMARGLMKYKSNS